MASEARPFTLPGGVPSEQRSVRLWPFSTAAERRIRPLTAGGGEALVHERVLHGAGHAQSSGRVDLQGAADVVEAGAWKLHAHRSHRAFGGLGRLVDEPADSGFREAAAGEAVEAGLVPPPRCCLLPPQQRPAEAG